MERVRILPLLASIAVATGLGGCLGEPGIEERWTRMEIVSSSADESDVVDLSGNETISVRARMTFRRLFVSAFVAELRASDTMTASMVDLSAEGLEADGAADVDSILANSVSAGREFHVVAGFPDLIRQEDFEFNSFTPELAGPISGLFLVVYAGRERKETNEDGEEIIVIDPFYSGENEILHAGIAIPLTAPAP